MATQIRPGAIIRRGAATIAPETMKFLVEHEDEVAKIVADIDARSEVFRELERTTGAASTELATATRDLAERETKLVDDLAAFETERAATAKQHLGDHEALKRRTIEVREAEADHAAIVADHAVAQGELDNTIVKVRALATDINASLAAHAPTEA